MDVKVVLFKRCQGVIPRLIRWQTDSKYCHAGLLVEDTMLVEAVFSGGVRLVNFKYDPETHDVFSASPHLSPAEGAAIAKFAGDQIGKGYDFWGCMRFISRRRLPENDKWFCSELVFESFKQAGFPLLNYLESYQVSPGDLAISPWLTKVEK